jgi:hypothetical protein
LNDKDKDSSSIIDSERKALGLTKRDPDNVTSFLQGDDQLFKTWVATPREPVANLKYKVRQPDGSLSELEETVPKLVATMALGNLNTKEVQLMRMYLELARRVQRHGYYNVAINLYYKVVFLCVSSQSHLAFLARQLFTENVSVLRKEESLSDTRDLTPQQKDKVGAFMDKIKSADGSSMWGKGGIKESGTYGMRSS